MGCCAAAAMSRVAITVLPDVGSSGRPAVWSLAGVLSTAMVKAWTRVRVLNSEAKTPLRKQRRWKSLASTEMFLVDVNNGDIFDRAVGSIIISMRAGLAITIILSVVVVVVRRAAVLAPAHPRAPKLTATQSNVTRLRAGES